MPTGTACPPRGCGQAKIKICGCRSCVRRERGRVPGSACGHDLAHGPATREATRSCFFLVTHLYIYFLEKKKKKKSTLIMLLLLLHVYLFPEQLHQKKKKINFGETVAS